MYECFDYFFLENINLWERFFFLQGKRAQEYERICEVISNLTFFVFLFFFLFSIYFFSQLEFLSFFVFAHFSGNYELIKRSTSHHWNFTQPNERERTLKWCTHLVTVLNPHQLKKIGIHFATVSKWQCGSLMQSHRLFAGHGRGPADSDVYIVWYRYHWIQFRCLSEKISRRRCKEAWKIYNKILYIKSF